MARFGARKRNCMSAEAALFAWIIYNIHIEGFIKVIIASFNYLKCRHEKLTKVARGDTFAKKENRERGLNWNSGNVNIFRKNSKNENKTILTVFPLASIFLLSRFDEFLDQQTYLTICTGSDAVPEYGRDGLDGLPVAKYKSSV